MQQEINIQGESVRTVIKFFTNLSGQTSDSAMFFVTTDVNNNPIKLIESQTDLDFELNSKNLNIPVSFTNVYSGSVVYSERNFVISPAERAKITETYINSIIKTFTEQNKDSKFVLPFSAVFFEEHPFNDYYLNVKINRSIDVLNTLNIYNVPINETPKFQNNTGVLFGKIESIQVLLDDDGNKMKIPLRDAVVGIFNPSDEIPAVGSVDQNGNRISLSLYENLPYNIALDNLKKYASFQSYLTDVNYSKNDFNNEKIPAKYKYTTITNENGEFILQNLPIGSQTLMVEIDLLKQGLNPEEVALNFFPYPTVDDPNVSTIPHYNFNQYPINIVPSWGDFQTGYTQINLSIVLDLRKWVTYYTFPISHDGKVIERLYSEGVTNPVTVKIRDMAKPFDFRNPAKVELVKIPDVYDRNLDLYNAWNNELKIKNNIIEFSSTNFNAFKLPANLYDPNGIGTNNQKGVWLGAYQIKVVYPTDQISFQSTGFEGQWYTADGTNYVENHACHYDLNRTLDKNTFTSNWDITSSPEEGSGIGKFPYEKPWSLTYPYSYKITKKPETLNPFKAWDSVNDPILGTTNYPLTLGQFQLEPRYLDGDLVGGKNPIGTNANGYGLQNYGKIFYGNNFSREVTQNEIWRYEGIDWWQDEFSNGYNYTLTQSDFNKYPNTPNGKPYIDGELWQRLEAGFAYWLRPRGWPRIDSRDVFGDHLLDNEFTPNSDHNNNSVYNSYFSYFKGIYNYLDELTLGLGSKAPWFSKYGKLSCYRIEKPYYLNPKKPPFSTSFVELNFGRLIGSGSRGGGDNYDQFGLTDFEILNFNDHYFFQANDIIIRITNKGTTDVTINGEEIKINDKKEFKISDPNPVVILPANSEYDPISNSYGKARYFLEIHDTVSSQSLQNAAPHENNSGNVIQLQNALTWFPTIINLYAYPENDDRRSYYISSRINFAVDYARDISGDYIPLIDTSGFSPEDVVTMLDPVTLFARSLWGVFRIHGLAWMPDFGGKGWPEIFPDIRWTNALPETYLKSTISDMKFKCLAVDGSGGLKEPDWTKIQ